MKKLILSLIVISMLTGCVSEPVKQEEVTTTAETENSSASKLETSITKEVINTETTKAFSTQVVDVIGEPLGNTYDNSQQDGYTDICRKFIRDEKVGGIAVGMEYDEVVRKLGEPSTQKEPYNSMDGILQSMTFSDGEVSITFVIENDIKSIKDYAFNKSTNAVTDSGIGIGSSREDVLKKYGNIISINNSVWTYCFGREDIDYIDYNITSETINEIPVLMIGEFYQGSFTFYFDENDKVICIVVRDMTSL